VFLPSPLESFGRPVVEAAAAGVPIICADNPGHAGLVSPGATARVFPVGDVDAAVQCVRDALRRPEVSSQMSARAVWMAEHYSASAVADDLWLEIRKLKQPDATEI
jgi:glycosyltransferase involved in cell wall biosynthesis